MRSASEYYVFKRRAHVRTSHNHIMEIVVFWDSFWLANPVALIVTLRFFLLRTYQPTTQGGPKSRGSVRGVRLLIVGCWHVQQCSPKKPRRGRTVRFMCVLFPHLYALLSCFVVHLSTKILYSSTRTLAGLALTRRPGHTKKHAMCLPFRCFCDFVFVFCAFFLQSRSRGRRGGRRL